DIFTAAFDVMLRTNDGGSQEALAAGAIPGVSTERGNNPHVRFAGRSEFLNASSQGLNLDGEYYTTWLDTWGPDTMHNHDTTNPAEVGGHIALVSTVQSDISYILSNQSSFSPYMFHGGTNWGYKNDGDGGGGSPLMADTTSYDYGAPLDESGHSTPLYQGLQQTIFSYLKDPLPPILERNPLIDVSSFTLTPSVALFDSLPAPYYSAYPVNMEALLQSYGFILYRDTIANAVSGSLHPGD
ncbi:Beta-galactosidase-1-like protein, partial [Elasticomyces elasticus]